MERYEKAVGLKTIWLTIIRRWKIILCVFIPAAILTVFITQLFIPKQYQSTATFLNDAKLNTTTFNDVQLEVKKEKTINKTIQYLQDDYSISLTENDILNGLSFPSFNSNDAYVFKFSFTSKKRNIVKPVTQALSDATLETLTSTDFKHMKRTSVSDVASIGKDKQYLLIGLVASAILGLGIAFVDELVSDEVYDEDDLALLGSSSYGLIVTKK